MIVDTAIGHDRQPASTPSPVGKITRISVTYTVDTPDGPKHAIVGGPAMRRCAAPDRLEDLLDALALAVEDTIVAGGGMADDALIEQIRDRTT
jgi:hypothetical protein